MNTFKHKSLYAAIAGLGALGATGVAQAVSVNHDGLGQALIHPYYTVRSTFTGPILADAPDFTYNSLLSVVNSTASAKAVKVRFLEGRNSREVLDFNLYLSAKDVWTAAVIPTTDGAAIFTEDRSCTNPRVSLDPLLPTPFVNFAYSGSNDDKAGTTLDRTREGYVEIIEMGNVTGVTAVQVTHTGALQLPPAWPECNLPLASSDTVPGTGGLFGSMTLVNVFRGEDFGIDPVALDGFSSTALWFAPGDIKPNLANVNPKTSVVVAGASVFITDWATSTNTVDPVSAVLMHNNVYNEYVLAKETNSGTDWVVNFPTKNYYYTGTTVTKLFQSNFTSTGACDDVVVVQYDREERTRISQTSFSPPPPTTTDSLCWETNVISFNGTNVLGSKNRTDLPVDFSAGWVALNFNGSTVPAGRHQLIGGLSTVFNTRTGLVSTLPATTFNGLPVIGFAAITFENGTLSLTELGGAIQSNYGGNFNHKTTSDVK